MARIIPNAKKLGESVIDAVKDIGKSGPGFFNALGGKGASAPVAQSFGSKVAGGFGDVIMWPFKKSAKVAVWAIEQPIAYGLKAVRYTVKGVGGAYRNAPLLMVPLTAVAGIAAYSSHARHKAEQRTQADHEAQFAAIEAQVLAGNQLQQPQGPQAVATTYQVTPEDMRIMNERMKGGQGAPQTSHAEGIVAAREAAAAQQQPTQPTAAL